VTDASVSTIGLLSTGTTAASDRSAGRTDEAQFDLGEREVATGILGGRQRFHPRDDRIEDER
jgi:hypothetical protein